MMTKNRTCAAFALLATLLLSMSAQALLFRAYVASDGNDANPCTLPQPCRLLPAALAAVADGGEIWMLDSANYNGGTVVVAKSVSIVAVPGAIGSVVATGGSAISIAAAGLTVSLRNVVIVPLSGAGGNGVTMSGASILAVEDSVFANLTGAGVEAAAGRVRVSNSTFRNNHYAVLATANARADVASSKFTHNYVSVYSHAELATSSSISVSDSAFSMDDFSIVAESVGGATTNVNMTRCTVTYASTAGIWVFANASSNAYVTFGSSMFARNAAGYAKQFAGGTENIYTYQNNQFIENGTSFGTLTNMNTI